MNIEKYVWVFVMGIAFTIGIFMALNPLSCWNELCAGVLIIFSSIFGVSQTNNIFDAEFED